MNPDKIASFLSGSVEICGRKLRRPTLFTYLTMQETGSPLQAKDLRGLVQAGKVDFLGVAVATVRYVVMHSVSGDELETLKENKAELEKMMRKVSDDIPMDELLELAYGINEFLEKMFATRDWKVEEVAGQVGVPFMPPNGPPSTLPQSPS